MGTGKGGSERYRRAEKEMAGVWKGLQREREGMSRAELRRTGRGDGASAGDGSERERKRKRLRGMGEKGGASGWKQR